MPLGKAPGHRHLAARLFQQTSGPVESLPLGRGECCHPAYEAAAEGRERHAEPTQHEPASGRSAVLDGVWRRSGLPQLRLEQAKHRLQALQPRSAGLTGERDRPREQGEVVTLVPGQAHQRVLAEPTSERPVRSCPQCLLRPASPPQRPRKVPLRRRRQPRAQRPPGRLDARGVEELVHQRRQQRLALGRHEALDQRTQFAPGPGQRTGRAAHLVQRAVVAKQASEPRRGFVWGGRISIIGSRGGLFTDTLPYRECVFHVPDRAARPEGQTFFPLLGHTPGAGATVVVPSESTP